MKWIFAIVAVLAILGGLSYWYVKYGQWRPGKRLDQHNDVVVFQNGLDYVKSHGRHFAPDGYYYGQMWQCVEFIKRYYHQAHGHAMPDVMGHAHSFYDLKYPQSALNEERGFYQFLQGGDMAPREEDYIVFASTSFGHVAVITEVGDDFVEVIQQNILGKPRERVRMEKKEGYRLYRSGNQAASAWLRLPKYYTPPAEPQTEAPSDALNLPSESPKSETSVEVAPAPAP